MNARRLQWLLAMMMLSALGTASAAVYPLTETPTGPDLSPGDTGLFEAAVTPGTFSNDWYFSLASPSTVNGAVVNVNLSTLLNITGLALELVYDYGLPGMKTYSGLGDSFTLTSLSSGPYELIVSGDATGSAGGVYAGAVTTVPLPAAAWLLLSGLAGLGVLARRRRVEPQSRIDNVA
jgi:hypothetical protein